jgi:ABC-type sugar transport system permease subunit
VAPMILGFSVFSLIPVVVVVLLSLFNWDLSGTPKFVGLHQYETAMADPEFWHSLGLTGLYVVVNLPLQWLLSLGLALLLRRNVPGSGVFRVIFLIPWVLTPIAIATLWKWILNPLTGVLNYLMSTVGLHSVDWFSSPWALKTVALVNIWQFTGISTAILLVGMQAIPEMYFEAAKIDGAGGWKTLIHISVPLLRPTILYLVVTGVLGSFQVFDTVYGLTLGGPGNSTEVFYFYLYQQAFQFSNFGYASALAVMLFILLMLFTVGQLIYFRRASDDDDFF